MADLRQLVAAVAELGRSVLHAERLRGRGAEPAAEDSRFIQVGTVSHSGLAFLPAKSIFCYLPVLTGLNRQKVAENGKNENDPLAHFTCFLNRHVHGSEMTQIWDLYSGNGSGDTALINAAMYGA